jgi:hypothetical protein
MTILTTVSGSDFCLTLFSRTKDLASCLMSGAVRVCFWNRLYHWASMRVVSTYPRLPEISSVAGWEVSRRVTST